MADTVQTLPGKHRKFKGILQIELCEANMAHITIRHPAIDMDEIVRAWWVEHTKVVVDKELDPVNLPFKQKPWKHQLDAIRAFGHASYFALWFDMGTGKTKTLLDIAGAKYLQGEIEILVVLAPNGVHRQWIMEQVPEHLFDQIERAVIYTSGSLGARRIGIEDILSRKNKFKIIAINVESISSDKGKKLLLDICSAGKTMIVVDESGSIKGYGSKRTEAAHEAARLPTTVVRACLDGTPVTQGAQDLWGPLELLSPTILQCPNWFAFRSRYLVMGGARNDQVVAYKNLEDLQRRMYSCSQRITKEECFDLPLKESYPRYVEMTPEQEKHYTDMKYAFIHEMKSGTVVNVKDAMVRINKLRQILGGFVITKHPDGTDPITGKTFYRNETTIFGTGKLDACVDIIRGTTEKVIIWCIFREEADQIEAYLRKNLNTNVVRYTGKESDAERDKNKTLFKTDPGTQTIIATMAMCRGHNLTEATMSIWYSFPDSYMQYSQANDRNYRAGQEKPCTYIRLTVPGTEDERAFARLTRKEEFAHMMMDVRELLGI